MRLRRVFKPPYISDPVAKQYGENYKQPLYIDSELVHKRILRAIHYSFWILLLLVNIWNPICP